MPVYSHHRYDIVPGELQWIRRPDLLVVEGLTVLQGGSGGVDPPDQGVEPLIDLSVYVHADEDALAHWHTERLLGLRMTTGDPPSEFLLMVPRH